MSFRYRAVVATALFTSLAGFAAQGSARTTVPANPLLPQSAVLLQVPALGIDDNTPDAAQVPMMPQAPEPALAEEQPDDQVVYPTLTAAVAAQSDAAGDEQLRCLAGAVYFESRGEPLSGQLAVAEVILNRVDAGRFGGDVCRVVGAPGQFSFVRGGRVPSAPDNRDGRTARAIAKVAMNDAFASPAPSALYFHARRVAPGWKRARVASIGNHVFYR